MTEPRYPSLYQINTRVRLTEWSRRLGRKATLNDVPDEELDRIAAMGIDWVWLLSVWQTGEAARMVSLRNSEWLKEFRETLPDLADDDIPGSGFAIHDYRVSAALGGDAELARLRDRLRKRKLNLMLDFVPNHMAPDHPWVERHPDYFVSGTEGDLSRNPQNYVRLGQRILAHGRDPHFAGWPDTLQIDYGNKAAREAMAGELLRIARQCDGVRCDMAMLVLPDVFERTWGIKTEPFWPEATRRVREKSPGFKFMAEVYWDLEWTLQGQGFDYTYDKRLYDRLHRGPARPAREHLQAALNYQDRMARFLENHDEPRAATAFPHGRHEAAAVVTFLSPGLRFFHDGQLEGRRQRISPHLGRAPDEAVDERLEAFYRRLMEALRRPAARNGTWRLLECAAAWPGNGSSDDFIAMGWQDPEGLRLLAAVNYSDHRSQCYVRLPYAGLHQARWVLSDLLGDARYERDGPDLQAKGLYLDVGPWQAHVFEVKPE
jgi:glycosidase